MFFIITILEILIILTGLVCLRRGGPVSLFLLLFISIIDSINENIITAHSEKWWNTAPNVFYNIYSLLEIVCWIIIYISIFHKRNIKIIIALCGSAIIFYSLIDIFIIHSPAVFHTQSYSCFSIASICFSVIYLRTVDGKEYHDLRKDPIFWICAGSICFHCIFLINLFTMFDKGYWRQKEAQEVFHILQSSAVVIYYLLLCTGYIISYCRYSRKTTQVL